jgi:hypothetical protein
MVEILKHDARVRGELGRKVGRERAIEELVERGALPPAIHVRIAEADEALSRDAPGEAVVVKEKVPRAGEGVLLLAKHADIRAREERLKALSVAD